MGMVYEAVHQGFIDGINRTRTIKVLRPEIASNRDATQRSLARSTRCKFDRASWHHSYFLTVDTPRLGQLIAMEFLEGLSQTARLDRLRVLTVSEAFRIARQVAVALQSARGRSVIHRDLEPDNLMLVRDSERRWRARQNSGLWVAKISEGLGDQTETGMLMGTPAYVTGNGVGKRSAATYVDRTSRWG
ncbi:MAG: hypothetical protein U0787_24095 [Polyangia bacterium]